MSHKAKDRTMMTVENGVKHMPLEENKLLVETFLKKEFNYKREFTPAT